jgi:hypothetical protein
MKRLASVPSTVLAVLGRHLLESVCLAISCEQGANYHEGHINMGFVRMFIKHQEFISIYFFLSHDVSSIKYDTGKQRYENQFSIKIVDFNNFGSRALLFYRVCGLRRDL